MHRPRKRRIPAKQFQFLNEETYFSNAFPFRRELSEKEQEKYHQEINRNILTSAAVKVLQEQEKEEKRTAEDVITYLNKKAHARRDLGTGRSTSASSFSSRHSPTTPLGTPTSKQPRQNIGNVKRSAAKSMPIAEPVIRFRTERQGLRFALAPEDRPSDFDTDFYDFFARGFAHDSSDLSTCTSCKEVSKLLFPVTSSITRHSFVLTPSANQLERSKQQKKPKNWYEKTVDDELKELNSEEHKAEEAKKNDKLRRTWEEEKLLRRQLKRSQITFLYKRSLTEEQFKQHAEESRRSSIRRH